MCVRVCVCACVCVCLYGWLFSKFQISAFMETNQNAYTLDTLYCLLCNVVMPIYANLCQFSVIVSLSKKLYSYCSSFPSCALGTWWSGAIWESRPLSNEYLLFTGEANTQLSLFHLAVLRSLWNFVIPE